jgi:gamma-glutamyltranspeptidase/glutathione hydrolase
MESSDTTYFGVVDKHGNAVSFINSLKSPWGSGLVAGNTGIVLQNCGNGFTLNPNHVNVYAPHKRPFHTINPAMVLKDGKPYMLMGCCGGDAQTMAMTQLFTNIVDFGMNILDSIEAKRWTHLKASR